MIKITRLKITNYRGIKALEAETPNGAIAKGRNGSGKTSVLNAIGAALAAGDIGPDAVRIGEDSGEILIDLDVAGKALHVRRRFGSSGSKLTIQNADGDTKASPAKVLQELLGSSPLDVIAVVLEKDARKRRELVLSALPVRATLEQLRRWVPRLPEDFDASGHGLEVVSTLRASAYEKRTKANREAKEATEKLASAESACRAVSGPLESARTVAEATALVVDAAEVVRRLEVQSAEARGADKLRSVVTEARESAAMLRAEAEAAYSAEDHANRSDLARKVRERTEAIEHLEKQLADERRALRELQARETEYERADKRRRYLAADADHAEKRAYETESRIAAVATVSPEDLERSASELAHARAELLAAKATEARAMANAADAEADRLDAIVEALTHEAPAALLAECPGAPAGIQIDGDEIKLGGVSLDRLCGQEQMVFAADIARALSPGVGFLVVDGLERLDPEQLEAFVASATRDGRQLFGSLVDRGELVLAAIEAENGGGK